MNPNFNTGRAEVLAPIECGVIEGRAAVETMAFDEGAAGKGDGEL